MFFVCTICTRETKLGDYICSQCTRKIRDISSATIRKTLTLKTTLKKDEILTVQAGAEYREIVRAAILTMKYARNPQIAGHIATLFPLNLPLFTNSILCPVPLHYRRLISRRYNQATEIAREISRQNPNCYVSHLLKRTRQTKPQRNMDTNKRYLNLKKSIVPSNSLKGVPKGQKIILIDDVCTTGATLVECTKVLYDQGKEFNVQAYVLALASRSEPPS